jgi:hypothetical protein
MPDPAAVELLHDIASLQRRQFGGFILLAADRSRAWLASQPERPVSVDPTVLRDLQSQSLIAIEPYAEKKPRGTQILGMTSKGWGLIPRA